MQNADTLLGNQLAWRAAFICFLCQFYGLLASCEQPNGTVMYYICIFQRLLVSGFKRTNFPFCNHGTPFQKMSAWVTNNPLMKRLEDTCNCGSYGHHFKVEGTFTQETLKDFCKLCRPDAIAVFGREPKAGEAVAAFSGSYPRPAMLAVAKVNMESTSRPSHVPPFWLKELCHSLHWTPCFSYHFLKPGHININEELAYKSLVKHAARDCPDSKIPVIQDSRVVIGANAKGRSSSSALNWHIVNSLPYIIGGNLYFGSLHVNSDDNISDAPSRDKPIPRPTRERSLWLEQLDSGSTVLFDLVVAADTLKRPYSFWARFVLLLSCHTEKTSI